MVITETLKVMDGGARLLVMTDSNALCILELDRPLPAGYKIGCLELPLSGECVLNAQPGGGVYVPVIAVRLAIGEHTTHQANPQLFTQ